MGANSDALDSWRAYFRSADANIFDVIENAIMVAAADCPKELRLRRARIAELLFFSRLTRCLGCNRVALAVPGQQEEGDNEEGNGFKESPECNKGSLEKGSKNDATETGRMASLYSYDEAEALTEEIEEESQTIGEVFRIKGILDNHEEESEGALFESLRRLELMGITVEILKATEIGRSVSSVRKHGSKRIQHLARTLIEGWKKMVDEWLSAESAISEGSPDSVNPSVVDEGEGLPSPPLDEGAFLATQTTSIELSQFFDGMDDDGNPGNSGGLDKISERMNSADGEKNQMISKHEVINGQRKPSNCISGSKPAKLSTEQNANGDARLQQQRKDLVEGQKKHPAASVQDKSKCSTEISAKLEAAKRKLHERYKEVETAKRQRKIQVMELHDLPKQGLVNRNFHPRPGFNNRNRSNVRW